MYRQLQEELFKLQEKHFNMTKQELENIITEQQNLKNLPNNKLIEFMDKLSADFEITKQNIINTTIFLDKLEELYNNTLKEFQSRNK